MTHRIKFSSVRRDALKTQDIKPHLLRADTRASAWRTIMEQRANFIDEGIDLSGVADVGPDFTQPARLEPYSKGTVLIVTGRFPAEGAEVEPGRDAVAHARRRSCHTRTIPRSNQQDSGNRHRRGARADQPAVTQGASRLHRHLRGGAARDGRVDSRQTDGHAGPSCGRLPTAGRRASSRFQPLALRRVGFRCRPSASSRPR